jgi:hypothetical protein
VIDVTMRRYIGPTDANGYLLNLSRLRSRGIVGDTAQITLPAYDVDETRRRIPTVTSTASSMC